MKLNLLLLSLAITGMVSCSSSNEHSKNSFGKQFDTTGTTTVNEAISALALGSNLDCKVTGKVKEVCQGEGCWLTLEQTDGGSFMVRIKDQSFHFPKDIAGKQVLVSGILHRDTLEADSASQSAIAEGNTPGTAVSMDATGLIVR